MRQSISESEWAVMELLWGRPGGALTMAEIVAGLDGRHWQYTTIRTMVTRLADKKFVRAERDGKNFRYSAAVPADACRLEEAESFLDRVYKGSVSAMVSGLSKQGRVDKAELASLKAMIEAMEDDG